VWTGTALVVDYEVLSGKLATSALLPRKRPPSRIVAFFSMIFAPAKKL
jgi:hypothetical protein